MLTKERDTEIQRLKQLRSSLKGFPKDKGSMFNSWRSKVYTKKGKKIGFPDKWKTFEGFADDMSEGWEKGKILKRKDQTKPYSKENCMWAEKGSENNSKFTTLTYESETKTLIEWAVVYNMNYNGIRQRYYRGKNYTPEEIIFGKQMTGKRKQIFSINVLSTEQEKKNKVSKMLSAYRCKDKKRGLKTAITNDELRDIIENRPCIYCGDTENVGLDRIDNSIGHILSNVVPCCYECNVARGNNFSHEEMLFIGEAIKVIKEKRNQNETLHNFRTLRFVNSDCKENRQHPDGGGDNKPDSVG